MLEQELSELSMTGRLAGSMGTMEGPMTDNQLTGTREALDPGSAAAQRRGSLEVTKAVKTIPRPLCTEVWCTEVRSTAARRPGSE